MEKNCNILQSETEMDFLWEFIFFVYIFVLFPVIMEKTGSGKDSEGGIFMQYEKFEKVRKEQYPMTAQVAYLDTSTSGMVSRRAKDAMVAYMEERFEHAVTAAKLNELFAWGDGLRATAAKMFHADAEEIFFSHGASEMINVFSAGVDLKENANVIVTGLTFPSTPYAWVNRVGEENVRMVLPENYNIPFEKIVAQVDENTAVISLCLVENTTGFMHDLKKISAFCQEKGIYLALDITQCVGAMKIDVKETPVDFIATSSFKWLGCEYGIGIGYVSKRVMDKVKSGSIILMHNNADNVVESTRLTLDWLTKAGYKVVSIGQLIYHEDYHIDANGMQHKN